MTDKRYKILLAGEFWVTTATHIKGFDQFATVTFHLGAEPLVEALKDSSFDLRYMPSHEAQRDFPQSAEDLADYGAVILSDIGSNTLLLHPDTWIHSKRTPNRLRALKSLRRGWGRIVDGRRILQLPGHKRRRALSRNAGRGGFAGRDPAVRRPGRGARGFHAGDQAGGASDPGRFPGNGRRCSASTRSSRRRARILATVSADYGEPPLLVAGGLGKGRTLAWTSDIGPHWLPPEFAAWPGYARLWRQALEWLVGAR